jgi:hypothetical protein
MNRAVGDAEPVVVEPSDKSEYAVGHICKAALAVLLVCISVSAQSAPTQSRTFRVHGTIRAFTGSIVPRAEVTFKGEQITKTVSSDSRGMYGAELPVGAYTMTASWAGVEKYRRPLFRVESARAITLNITSYPDAPNCDPVFSRLASPDGTPKTPAPTQDDYSDVCGGRDYLPITSEDNPTLDLLIQYSFRRRSDGENTYVGYDARGPVFVAYNLFTLTANKVVYDAKNRTIAASGNVVVVDGSGKTQHADSIRFKIENGQAVPLP